MVKASVGKTGPAFMAQSTKKAASINPRNQAPRQNFAGRKMQHSVGHPQELFRFFPVTAAPDQITLGPTKQQRVPM